MNVTVYDIILYFHIVSAVLAIGPLFVLLLVIKQLNGVQREIERSYVSLISVAVRFIMHAGHALVLTGALLILFGPWPWYTSWVIMTLGVMLLSAFFLASGFTRVLRRFGQAEDKRIILSRLWNTTWIYILLMLVMLWLMVQKPILW
ncbi:hypothetical protein NCCP2222_06470 [Sporosarcina sp. NCCP-2222]|uniref:DUF2269 family protein n=1 Tax=Sporosarcina sp. NCCP-2222 TaxID=2935073 RepID=UPI00207FCF9D|nr:DUF2269 family protein [Sporosarcina sp. NCCP-2222]GKV54700.1 hypothetical protein NCCP2222_06470 [Sporosarcina sp. NCCP-2222]